MTDYYKTIYPLRYIIRYSNQVRITNESVAEHSFFVSALLLKLHEEYMFDLGMALKYAICHDMPEVFVGDIPYNVKTNIPGSKEEIKRYELKMAYDRLPLYVYNSIIALEEKETPEVLAVRLADAIQVVQYTSNEIDMGNKDGIMPKIKLQAEERVAVLEDKLKRYRR